MVTLPFCHFELRAARPKPGIYPNQINSLGDHLRARRMDLKLLQKQVANQIGVHEQTITTWERNATSPEIRYIPAILNFLGYNPIPKAQTLPEQLVGMRKMLGLSQQKMAEKLGVDPATIKDWEAGLHRPTGKSLDVIGRFFRSGEAEMG
jgi:transcriptional regulator with XRE-family HTH domain